MRGFSLLETVLAMSLLLLALALTFSLFFTGSRSFYSSHQKLDLHREARLAMDIVSRDLASTSASSLCVVSDAVAIGTCLDGDGVCRNDASGRPIWQAYLLVFRSGSQLRRKRIPLATPTSLSQPLDRYDDGSGPHPLSFYRSGGKRLIDYVETFQLTRLAPAQIELYLRLEHQPQSRQAPAHFEVRTRLGPRLTSSVRRGWRGPQA